MTTTRFYECVLCQTRHYEDEIYDSSGNVQEKREKRAFAEHLLHQSKHGIGAVTETAAENFARFAATYPHRNVTFIGSVRLAEGGK